MLSLTVLASGSKGNCSLVASGRTRLLVDAGLSCREIFRRLTLRGEDPLKINAVLISHEHCDHVRGIYVLARKLHVPVFFTGVTYEAWQRWAYDSGNGGRPELARLQVFEAGREFCVGDIAVSPFTISHDAADPVGFTFRADGLKFGLVTDLGCITRNVVDNIRGCDGLMIESNHDVEMLRVGPYPWIVKQRVMSRVGHLSNEALAQFFLNSYDGAAAFLVLAHLSEQNNHPDLARSAAERALTRRRHQLAHRLMLAQQHEPLAPIRL